VRSREWKSEYYANTMLSNTYFTFISNLQKKDSVEIKNKRMEGGLTFNIFLIRGWVAIVGMDLLQNEEHKIKFRPEIRPSPRSLIFDLRPTSFVPRPSSLLKSKKPERLSIPEIFVNITGVYLAMGNGQFLRGSAC